MPYNIRKVTGGYKVCKKFGDRKCLPGKSKSKEMAKKRITAVSMNENFDQIVNDLLKTLI